MKVLLILAFPILVLSWNCGNAIDAFCQSYACPPNISNFALLNGVQVSLNTFNAVCFGNYNTSAPTLIGGRMAVSNNFYAQNFTIGNRVSTNDIPYSLIVGGSALWIEGEIYPVNSGIYVGGILAAPPSISSRKTGGPCNNCPQSFEASRSYYNVLSATMNSATPNADIFNAVIRCNSNSTNVNIINIDYLTFIAQYYGGIKASNSCVSESYFIFNIRSSTPADISFGGQGFHISRVIYNIIGANSVSINGKVKGTVLAPNTPIIQTSGQVTGTVIGGDCSLTNITTSCTTNSQTNSTTPPIPSNTFTTGNFNVPTLTTASASPFPGVTTSNIPDFVPSGVCGAFFDTGCTGRTYILGGTLISFSDYDVISFNDMKSAVGAVKGNVAVQNNFEGVKSFTVGDSSNTPVPMIVGNNVYWSSGSLFPTGNKLIVGGTFVGSQNLQNQSVPLKCKNDCVTSVFTIGQECYQNISQQLQQLTPNVASTLQSQRMVVNCGSASDMLHIFTCNASDFERTLWFELRNCNPAARWVINIAPGDDAVRFSAGSFPARPENIVYNIGGQDRIVNVQTAVLGSILAPNNILNQNGGVIVGKVVAADIPQILQVNSLVCTPTSQVLEEMYNTATNLAMGALTLLIFPVSFFIFRNFL